MEWLCNDRYPVLSKYLLAPYDGVKRSQASIVQRDGSSGNTEFYQCLSHLLWLIIILRGSVVTAQDKVIDLALPVKFGRSLHSSCKVWIDVAVCGLVACT